MLDYEQREEEEELRGLPLSPSFSAVLMLCLALEARSRTGAIKIRYVG